MVFMAWIIGANVEWWVRAGSVWVCMRRLWVRVRRDWMYYFHFLALVTDRVECKYCYENWSRYLRKKWGVKKSQSISRFMQETALSFCLKKNKITDLRNSVLIYHSLQTRNILLIHKNIFFNHTVDRIFLYFV